MMPKRTKIRVYDMAQRIWVSTCIAVTLASTGFIAVKLYNYLTKVKPIKKEMEEQFKEELLREGRMLRDQA